MLINNKSPLISYPIEALAAAGISQIAIVVGYLGDMIIEVLGHGSQYGVNLEYIFNPDYLGGAAISADKARDWAQGEPVILCMGDHVIKHELIRRLLDKKIINETLCVDYTPTSYHQIDEATKVSIDKTGCITDIGKNLSHWDALDSGVFVLTEKFFQAVDKLILHLGNDTEISDVIRFFISQGHRFDTCNVSGCFWLDVDTREDLIKARK